jgi:hypothetical protein
MKIVTVKHEGDLKVCWKDCYQHTDHQQVATVKQCDKIVIMGDVEFHKLQARGML